MQVDCTFSQKMTVLSVWAMLSVIFIHSTAYLTMSNPAQWNVFGEVLITRSFTRWAVPFFFVVSGFWFGRGAFIAGRAGYGDVLQTKVKTLFVPYLCWCVIGFLVALPLIVGTNVLGGKGVWERTIIEIPGIWARVDAFFGVTNVGPKSNMPLWYVRCLLVMFILAPVWKLILKVPHGAIGLLILALFDVCVYPVPVPYLSVPTFAFAWFAIGLALAQFPVEAWRLSRLFMLNTLAVYSVGSVMIALIVSGYLPIEGALKRVALDRLEYAIVPIAGILFFWGLYDQLVFASSHVLPWGLKQTFFIYCLHEVICEYLMAAAKFILGKTDAVTLCCSFTVPFISISFCVFFAMIIHRLSIRSYSIVCGGRDVWRTSKDDDGD